MGWCSRTWSGLLLAAAACCLLGEHAHVPIPEGMALGRGIDPSDKPHGPASAEPRAPAARPTGYTKVFHAHCAPNLPATTPRRRLLSVAPLVLAELVLCVLRRERRPARRVCVILLGLSTTAIVFILKKRRAGRVPYATEA